MKISHTKYFFEPQGQRGSKLHKVLVFLSVFVSSWFNLLHAQRQDIPLNDNWKTIASDSNQNAFNGFEQSSYKTTNWKTVNVPHNWDAYEGYRRMLHGNKHGYAWYKKSFAVNKQNGKRYFLFFEGVGSYATVWINGKQVGTHAGGRTSFTIDITNAIISGKQNDLAVRADHPPNIKDLPWVCGGCSDERGFSEGSQPMGIFRPVHLIITNEVRIEPFGVHVWNDTSVTEKSATLNIATALKSYSKHWQFFTIATTVYDKNGKVVAADTINKTIDAVGQKTVQQHIKLNKKVYLWNLTNPYLYKIVTKVLRKEILVDKVETFYGIRSIKFDRGNSNRFFLNGKPVFINGIAEYEHMLGSSHAFAPEQIKARVNQIQAAGFNAFRDAHHPHNLLYQQLLDEKGLLWWTQMSAHVWYNTKEFRDNFKTLLKEWVLERRNSPSLILWGLQNESKLPADFAKECSDIIRQLDPTASSQRLITTCNGGEGTDWDVPQNWTGTYGGNPNTYGDDLKKQVLVGEYGAWRTIDLHAEGGFQQNGVYSEDRFCNLMAKKIQLAESVKDSVAGHFHWLFSSHDNPGRIQGGEGYRELDKIGPVNYKGLFTPWDEPTDAYYMYRSMYADKYKEPMVYIPMHNWTNRWLKPGVKNGIVVYSNCDEVALYDKFNFVPIAKLKKTERWQPFIFNNINIEYSRVWVKGFVNGVAVKPEDEFRQFNIPLLGTCGLRMNPPKANNYIFRVNCGGDDQIDFDENIWLADNMNSKSSFYSTSWTNQFDIKPKAFASQRNIYNHVNGVHPSKLFQSFRYGKQELKYFFKVPDGEYLVELYFVEPWFGLGNINATGWRIFDVAINDKVVLKDVDIFKEVGHNQVLKKVVKATIKGGELVIHFPTVKASQAIIAAIAIATKNKHLKVPIHQVENVKINSTNAALHHWLNITDTANSITQQTFFHLPPVAYGADYIRWKTTEHTADFRFAESTDVYVGDTNSLNIPIYLKGFEKQKETVLLSDSTVVWMYKKIFKAGESFAVNNQVGLATIFFQPTTNIQPAYDLKPVVAYRPAQAAIKGDAAKTTVHTKDAVTFQSNNASVEWSIATGVADVYSITIRYANETGKHLKAMLQLFQADGTLMKEELITFTQSKAGKWNYAVTNTGSMINAGNYIINIKAIDAAGLSVSALDIQ